MQSVSLKNGFSLIELLITIAIVAILAAIATPSYTEYLVKERRSEAKAALTSIVGLMEQYYYDNNYSYANATIGSTIKHPTVVPADAAGSDIQYEISISATADAFKVVATPKNRQLSDGVLSIDNNLQKQWVIGSDTRNCWETSCS